MRIAETGFREYDLRWRFPEEVDAAGIEAVGLTIGTQLRARGLAPRIITGGDLRSYTGEVKAALSQGLVRAGIEVHDLGTCLTPTAYFARRHLGIPAVAMVTASHNPNGWTGVKLGFEPPFTHGPDDIAELRAMIRARRASTAVGGRILAVDGIREAYLDDLARGGPLARRLRVVCACGNGTAGLFAPELLARLGAEVIPLHTDPDTAFPHYNPNPEAMEMLHDMARAVRETGADLALGFDGDGDRCGVVDDTGEEIFADKLGVLIARDMAARHPGALFLADVKSTGLFASDPVLRGLGARAEYVRTGHSYFKRRLAESGAIAGFEKSGHFYFGPPEGHGYDCGLRAAVAVLRMLDGQPALRLSDLRRSLPRTWATPTMAPFCADTGKYAAMDRIAARIEALAAGGGLIGGRAIDTILRINGMRILLQGGAWALVRASSNTPNLIVVCESPESEAHLRAIFADIDAIIRTEPSVGAYDQTF